MSTPFRPFQIPDIVGFTDADQDHKIIGPVPGPGPGPLPEGSSKGLLRTGLDRSLYTPKDRLQTSLSAIFLQDSNLILS